MNFDIATLMDKPGVTVMQFCGMSVDDEVLCDQEAVGEILAEMEDGITVPIPVCETHLESIQNQYDVEELNI